MSEIVPVYVAVPPPRTTSGSVYDNEFPVISAYNIPPPSDSRVQYIDGTGGIDSTVWINNPYPEQPREPKKFHVCVDKHMLYLSSNAEVDDNMHRGDSIYTFYAADEFEAQDTFDHICIGWGLHVQC
jgi:hypothetical protein